MFQRMWLGMRAEDNGPGRPKRGILRLFEIIGDNLGRFLGCNFLCVLSLIPALAGIFWGLGQNSFPVILAAGALGGAVFGPFYGAMINGMLYALWDQPGNWWPRYRHCLARDWKDCLLPGAVLGALLALLGSEAAILILGGSLPIPMYVCTAVTLLVIIAVFTCFWPQRVFTDLSTPLVFRNSVFLCMAHPAAAFKAVLAQGIYWALIVVLLPHSTLLMPLLGLWLPGLMGLMLIYPDLNEALRMEERMGVGEYADDGEDEEEEDA